MDVDEEYKRPATINLPCREEGTGIYLMCGPTQSSSPQRQLTINVADDPLSCRGPLSNGWRASAARHLALHHIPSTLMHVDTPQDGNECLIGDAVLLCSF